MYLCQVDGTEVVAMPMFESLDGKVRVKFRFALRVKVPVKSMFTSPPLFTRPDKARRPGQQLYLL